MGHENSLFKNVVVIVFQSIFTYKYFKKIFFYFFKIIFDINTFKLSKNIKKY
jgi:hypothetical protein